MNCLVPSEVDSLVESISKLNSRSDYSNIIDFLFHTGMHYKEFYENQNLLKYKLYDSNDKPFCIVLSNWKKGRVYYIWGKGLEALNRLFFVYDTKVPTYVAFKMFLNAHKLGLGVKDIRNSFLGWFIIGYGWEFFVKNVASAYGVRDFATISLCKEVLVRKIESMSEREKERELGEIKNRLAGWRKCPV